MKKPKALAALMCLALLGGCAENQADRTAVPTAPPVETTAPVTTPETSVIAELNRSETLEYRGDGVIDAASFEIFDQYFHGNWVYSGEHPEWDVWDVKLGYSNEIPRYATDVLKDIYLDSGYAYLVLYTVMGDLVYTVPADQPDVMYEYYDVTDYGNRAREDYSYSYIKQKLPESDTLGYFGIRRMLCLENEIPQDVLIPHTLKTGDGRSWVNFWEKITVMFRSENEVTLKILCRADDGRDPFTPGYETPLETSEILYTIKRNGDEWTAAACDYAEEEILE